MKTYTKADVKENKLEDLVLLYAGSIEKDLVYVDHQKQTAGGRLDVLMVDSNKALVVAELKIIEDDEMLFQGLDYYDYVTTHVESFARLYKHHSIDPERPVRLLLIAPSFTQTLVTRCKWLDVPISLFAYKCLRFDGDEDVVPIFMEREIPTPPVPPKSSTLDDQFNYITDTTVRGKVISLLDEIKNWKLGHVTLDPIKDAISLKVNGRVFGYLYTRRQHFIIGTYDADNEWSVYAVKSDDDLDTARTKVKESMVRKMK